MFRRQLINDANLQKENSMNRLMFIPTFIFFCAAANFNALAQQTTTDDLSVSLTVESECQVDTAAVAFTGYSGTSNADAAGAINVTCTNGADYSVTLAATTNGDGVRTLTNGPSTLNYALYSDASRATIFPESSSATQTGTGSAQAIPVYGRIATGQTPTVGAYSDTVTVTVTY